MELGTDPARKLLANL